MLGVKSILYIIQQQWAFNEYLYKEDIGICSEVWKSIENLPKFVNKKWRATIAIVCARIGNQTKPCLPLPETRDQALELSSNQDNTNRRMINFSSLCFIFFVFFQKNVYHKRDKNLQCLWRKNIINLILWQLPKSLFFRSLEYSCIFSAKT